MTIERDKIKINTNQRQDSTVGTQPQLCDLWPHHVGNEILRISSGYLSFGENGPKVDFLAIDEDVIPALVAEFPESAARLATALVFVGTRRESVTPWQFSNSLNYEISRLLETVGKHVAAHSASQIHIKGAIAEVISEAFDFNPATAFRSAQGVEKQVSFGIFQKFFPHFADLLEMKTTRPMFFGTPYSTEKSAFRTLWDENKWDLPGKIPKMGTLVARYCQVLSSKHKNDKNPTENIFPSLIKHLMEMVKVSDPDLLKDPQFALELSILARQDETVIEQISAMIDNPDPNSKIAFVDGHFKVEVVEEKNWQEVLSEKEEINPQDFGIEVDWAATESLCKIAGIWKYAIKKESVTKNPEKYQQMQKRFAEILRQRRIAKGRQDIVNKVTKYTPIVPLDARVSNYPVDDVKMLFQQDVDYLHSKGLDWVSWLMDPDFFREWVNLLPYFEGVLPGSDKFIENGNLVYVPHWHSQWASYAEKYIDQNNPNDFLDANINLTPHLNHVYIEGGKWKAGLTFPGLIIKSILDKGGQVFLNHGALRRQIGRGWKDLGDDVSQKYARPRIGETLPADVDFMVSGWNPADISDNELAQISGKIGLPVRRDPHIAHSMTGVSFAAIGLSDSSRGRSRLSVEEFAYSSAMQPVRVFYPRFPRITTNSPISTTLGLSRLRSPFFCPELCEIEGNEFYLMKLVDPFNGVGDLMGVKIGGKNYPVVRPISTEHMFPKNQNIAFWNAWRMFVDLLVMQGVPLNVDSTLRSSDMKEAVAQGYDSFRQISSLIQKELPKIIERMDEYQRADLKHELLNGMRYAFETRGMFELLYYMAPEHTDRNRWQNMELREELESIGLVHLFGRLHFLDHPKIFADFVTVLSLSSTDIEDGKVEGLNYFRWISERIWSLPNLRRQIEKTVFTDLVHDPVKFAPTMLRMAREYHRSTRIIDFNQPFYKERKSMYFFAPFKLGFLIMRHDELWRNFCINIAQNEKLKSLVKSAENPEHLWEIFKENPRLFTSNKSTESSVNEALKDIEKFVEQERDVGNYQRSIAHYDDPESLFANLAQYLFSPRDFNRETLEQIT